MGTPYIGEIKMLGFGRIPSGWFDCNGQLLPISAYEALFTLIGTTYGGDGQSTFAVPDLRGRRPQHWGTRAGTTFVAGQVGGAESHTLVATEMPVHTHTVRASATAGQTSPAGTVWAPAPKGYGPSAGGVLASACVNPAGGGQPHENMPPFLAVTFVIAAEGVYPSQN